MDNSFDSPVDEKAKEDTEIEAKVEILEPEEASKGRDTLEILFIFTFGTIGSYLLFSYIFGFFPFAISGQWIGEVFIGYAEIYLPFPHIFFLLYWIAVSFLALAVIRHTKDLYVIGSIIGAGFIGFFIILILFPYLL